MYSSLIKCSRTCSKSLISLSCLFALISLFTVLFYLTQDNQFLSDSFFYYKRIFGMISIMLSLLLALNAIIGLYSIINSSASFIAIYTVISSFLAIITLFLAISVFIQCKSNAYIYNKTRSFCRNDEKYLKINQIYERGINYLCRSNCSCNILNITEFNVNPLKMNISSDGVLKIQDCPFYEQDFANLTSFIMDLKNLEDNFKCSGLCKTNEFYLFSNINKGQPEKTCMRVIFKNLFIFYILTGSVFVVNALILILFVLNSVFLYFKSPEKNFNFYEKLTPFQERDILAGIQLDNEEFKEIY